MVILSHNQFQIPKLTKHQIDDPKNLFKNYRFFQSDEFHLLVKVIRIFHIFNLYHSFAAIDQDKEISLFYYVNYDNYSDSFLTFKIISNTITGIGFSDF